MPLTLHLLPGEFAVCRLAPHEPVPGWAGSSAFCSVTRTAHELSIICPASEIPGHVKHEAGWRLLEFAGPFDFSAVGILASVITPLAAAGISLLAVATFDTDYVLVHGDKLDAALRTIGAAGHTVRRG